MLSSQRSSNKRKGRKTSMERGLKASLYLPNMESKVVPKGIIVESLGLLSGRKRTKRMLSSQRSSNMRSGKKSSVERGPRGSFHLPNMESKSFPNGIIMESHDLLSRRKRTKSILSSQRSSNTRKGRKTFMKRGLKDSFYLPNMESGVVPNGIIVEESLSLLSGRKGIFCPKDRPTRGKEGKPSWKGVIKVHCTFLIWNLGLSPTESLWRRALAYFRDERGRKGFFRL